MKQSKIFKLLTLLVLVTVFLSCQKNKTGDLDVKVVDGFGNALGAGHTVYIFRGKANYDSQIYDETAITNANGVASFYALIPGDYYADCQWENSLGLNTTSSGYGTVDPKMITTITIKP